MALGTSGFDFVYRVAFFIKIPMTERLGVASKVTCVIAGEVGVFTTEARGEAIEQFEELLLARGKGTGILEGDRVFVNRLAYDLKVPFTTRHLAEWGAPIPRASPALSALRRVIDSPPEPGQPHFPPARSSRLPPFPRGVAQSG